MASLRADRGLTCAAHSLMLSPPSVTAAPGQLPRRGAKNSAVLVYTLIFKIAPFKASPCVRGGGLRQSRKPEGSLPVQRLALLLKKTRTYNPSVTATPCQLPLHKGAIEAQNSDNYVLNALAGEAKGCAKVSAVVVLTLLSKNAPPPLASPLGGSVKTRSGLTIGGLSCFALKRKQGALSTFSWCQEKVAKRDT